MTNQQLYLAIGIPTLASTLGILTMLVSILLNNSRFTEISTELKVIARDLREFYATQRVHEDQITELKKAK